MASYPDSEYGHAFRNLQSTISLSKVNLDRNGNVTKAGKKWLEELLATFGYNSAMVDKLPPEYGDLARQIIEAHSDKPSEPGLYEEIPAVSLLNDLPDFGIVLSEDSDAP